MTEHYLSIAQSIDDLHSEDKELRLVATKALVTIAQTLGPERTREELLPYVTDYLDEDDAVLKALAGKLGVMLPEVGGLPYLDALLGPLETLASLDEITVRDDAIASINALATAAFSPQGGSVEAQGVVMSTVTRLAASEHPPSRCSASGLIAVPFAMGPAATKRDLTNVFNKLCADSEVSVRRAACVALGSSIAAALGDACADFLPQLNKFVKDSSDSVRLHAVNAAVAMCALLPDSGIAQIIAFMRTLSNDSVVRVRFMLADRLGSLVAVWPTKDAKVAVGLFKTLCGDAMPEVKAATVFNLDKVAMALPSDDIKKDALDIALKLIDDATPHVRNCLASTLLRALPYLPRATWSSQIVPACTRLLQDADPQVRLGVVASFSAAGAAGIKSDALSSVASALVPVISSLSKDTNWRVRENVIEQLPAVVISGGEISDELVAVCIAALTDRVATIRTAGASACKQLAVRNGGQWAASTLLPKINSALGNSRMYMHRVTYLHLVRMLAESMDAAFCKTELLPIVNKFALDSVANVRMNAALALRLGIQNRKFTAADTDGIVAKLKTDTDVDVRDVFTSA